MQIREETNTRVEMPAESTDSDTITIVGRRENVEKARKMIADIEKQMVRDTFLFTIIFTAIFSS